MTYMLSLILVISTGFLAGPATATPDADTPPPGLEAVYNRALISPGGPEAADENQVVLAHMDIFTFDTDAHA